MCVEIFSNRFTTFFLAGHCGPKVKATRPPERTAPEPCPQTAINCTAKLGSHGAYVHVVHSRAESDGRRVSTRRRHRHGHRQRSVTAGRRGGAGRQTTVGQQYAGVGKERRRRRDG